MDIKNIEGYMENNRLEAKLASNKLPKSVWETYSSFANTDGGIIVLGVAEDERRNLKVVGLNDPEKLKADFCNQINDVNKVSRNILAEKDIRIEDVDGKRVLVIEVPRANPGQRPIFVGTNVYNGTYKRNGDGDYHCVEEEIRAMFAEREGKSADGGVLPGR